MLEQQGYTFRFDRKYMTLKPPGKDRPVRFKTLGKNYTPEAIQRRILYPRSPAPAGKRTPPAHGLLLLLGEAQPRKLTGLRALYYSYLYRVGVLRKKPPYPSYAVREDIRKLDQRIEQAGEFAGLRFPKEKQQPMGGRRPFPSRCGRCV